MSLNTSPEDGEVSPHADSLEKILNSNETMSASSTLTSRKRSRSNSQQSSIYRPTNDTARESKSIHTGSYQKYPRAEYVHGDRKETYSGDIQSRPITEIQPRLNSYDYNGDRPGKNNKKNDFLRKDEDKGDYSRKYEQNISYTRKEGRNARDDVRKYDGKEDNLQKDVKKGDYFLKYDKGRDEKDKLFAPNSDEKRYNSRKYDEIESRDYSRTDDQKRDFSRRYDQNGKDDDERDYEQQARGKDYSRKFDERKDNSRQHYESALSTIEYDSRRKNEEHHRFYQEKVEIKSYENQAKNEDCLRGKSESQNNERGRSNDYEPRQKTSYERKEHGYRTINERESRRKSDYETGKGESKYGLASPGPHESRDKRNYNSNVGPVIDRNIEGFLENNDRSRGSSIDLKRNYDSPSDDKPQYLHNSRAEIHESRSSCYEAKSSNQGNKSVKNGYIFKEDVSDSPVDSEYRFNRPMNKDERDRYGGRYGQLKEESSRSYQRNSEHVKIMKCTREEPRTRKIVELQSDESFVEMNRLFREECLLHLEIEAISWQCLRASMDVSKFSGMIEIEEDKYL